jgi:hypothetical protein
MWSEDIKKKRQHAKRNTQKQDLDTYDFNILHKMYKQIHFNCLDTEKKAIISQKIPPSSQVSPKNVRTILHFDAAVCPLIFH